MDSFSIVQINEEGKQRYMKIVPYGSASTMPTANIGRNRSKEEIGWSDA